MFILKRVRSSKDSRRVDESGISIEALVKENEHSSYAGIVEKNVKTWEYNAQDNVPDNVRRASLGETTENELILQMGENIDIKSTNSSNTKGNGDQDKFKRIMQEHLECIMPVNYTQSMSSVENNVKETCDKTVYNHF